MPSIQKKGDHQPMTTFFFLIPRVCQVSRIVWFYRTIKLFYTSFSWHNHFFSVSLQKVKLQKSSKYEHSKSIGYDKL